MKNNRWKIAFWICFILLTFISVASTYSIVDQAITLTYLRDGYNDTENDLNTLKNIIIKADLSKTEVESVLKNNEFYGLMDFKKDTISLERISIVFEQEKLKHIYYNW